MFCLQPTCGILFCALAAHRGNRVARTTATTSHATPSENQKKNEQTLKAQAHFGKHAKQNEEQRSTRAWTDPSQPWMGTFPGTGSGTGGKDGRARSRRPAEAIS